MIILFTKCYTKQTRFWTKSVKSAEFSRYNMFFSKNYSGQKQIATQIVFIGITSMNIKLYSNNNWPKSAQTKFVKLE